ncbi:MAG: sulfite exporter TauE/SafE family protein [Candidatus Thiodiazotropha sp. (ex Monitilora ramsayi)]|nr:sulfite exporter TauE/SafE family protein [Candidatus Thiodiazotropha sp. (ex Monitilora ramsayi)]
MTYQLLFLFGAGFFGGVLNTIAGGGSFITFPALLFVGVAPISANATNTFASCAGYLSGAYAFRRELTVHKTALPRMMLVSLVGGSLGALLLLQTPESLFREAIPWLLLFATLLFAFGGWINRSLKRYASRHRHASLIGGLLLLLILLAASVYGGFFNAGLGIIVLSYLALAGYTDINAMNGLKLLISSVVSLIAIVLFIYDGAIAWYEGIVVMLGTLAGGYVAAHYSRQLPQTIIRNFVLVAGTLMSIYFFIEIYL